VLYAAFVGLLLASYVSPLQEIIERRAETQALQERLHEAEVHNTAEERLIEELNTPTGIERAARERYGMIRPGEKVYIIK
jgi:cell division protein FtsB